MHPHLAGYTYRALATSWLTSNCALPRWPSWLALLGPSCQNKAYESTQNSLSQTQPPSIPVCEDTRLARLQSAHRGSHSGPRPKLDEDSTL